MDGHYSSHTNKYIKSGFKRLFAPLEIIDWQGINAQQVPNWIAALVSIDENARHEASWKLLEYLHEYAESPEEYQDVLITDIPMVIAPVFVELLNHPQTDKDKILDILSILAYYKSVVGLDKSHLIRANQVYQILLQYFDLYFSFLNSQDKKTKIAAMYLLSRFEEKSPQVVDKLLNLIDFQTGWDELSKEAACEIIFRKIQVNESLSEKFSPRFVQTLQLLVAMPEEHLSIRATAANYLFQLLGDKVDTLSVDVIATALTPPHSDEFNTETNEYINTLFRFGGKHAVNTLLRILDTQKDIWVIFRVAATLLDLSFTDKNTEDIQISVFKTDEKGSAKVVVNLYNHLHLSDLQKNILQHLIAKEAIWEVETNLFDIFSLPNHRAALQLLLVK